jgi:hypothetical protein
MATPYKEATYICTNCLSIMSKDAILRATNPFLSNDEIQGCPICKDVNTLSVKCEAIDCKQLGTMGTPTKEGYRWTCYKHQPKEN